MQRRNFLVGSLALGMGVGRSVVQAESAAPERDIIDCHTHFYDPSRPQGVPWPAKNSPLYRTVLPKDLRVQKQFQPVTGTVVVEASPWVEDNAWLLDLAKDDPFLVGIVGNLKPGEPEFAQHLARFAANPLYRGIRVSNATLKLLLERNDLADLKRLAERDLALDVNGGPDTPALVAQLAPRLPDLRVVINHVGNVRITKEPPPQVWQAGIRVAAQQRNVFCKISALVEGAAFQGNQAPGDLEFYRPYIDVVWNSFGDERVIYGSNWPVSDRAADYFTVQRLAMEYAAEQGNVAVNRFCSLNAKRAYQWIERRGSSNRLPR
jgi:L-fuconolactonase